MRDLVGYGWKYPKIQWPHDARVVVSLVLNYEDDTFQSLGAFGFDVFGLTSTRAVAAETREVLMPEG